MIYNQHEIRDRRIQIGTEAGRVTATQRYRIATQDGHDAPEITLSHVPMALSIDEARILAAAPTQAVEQAEAWERAAGAEGGEA